MSIDKESDVRIPDEQLMRWFDGELEEAAAAKLARALEQDAEARGKLDGLELGSTLLRGVVEEDGRGDGIADAVMAAIDAEDKGGDRAEVVPLRKAEPRVEAPRPANDNAKLIYMIATAAAAVAAGLFLWGRSADVETPSAHAPAPVITDTAAPAAEPAPPPPRAPAVEDEPGVEIASVSVGNRQSGNVFYISAGDKSAASSTAVVWVTDLGE